VQKAGRGQVLRYGERSDCALTAAGATVILFTTERGTPRVFRPRP
jgi:altronate dehydratase